MTLTGRRWRSKSFPSSRAIQAAAWHTFKRLCSCSSRTRAGSSVSWRAVRSPPFGLEPPAARQLICWPALKVTAWPSLALGRKVEPRSRRPAQSVKSAQCGSTIPWRQRALQARGRVGGARANPPRSARRLLGPAGRLGRRHHLHGDNVQRLQSSRMLDLAVGAHISAVGSYTPEMQEIPAETVQRARVMVDSRSAALAETGDLIQPIQRGLDKP